LPKNVPIQNVLGKEELAKDMRCSAGNAIVCGAGVDEDCKLMNSSERVVREEAAGGEMN
jgi:hypothetical protein